jgi:uroporphyrinogen decarboxylase
VNSREIVQRTLDYSHPKRVARSFMGSDFDGSGCSVKTQATEWKKVGENRWEMIDEWGNFWGRVDPTSKGEVIKGVLEGVDNYDSYEFPDYSKAEDYTIVKMRREKARDKWFIGYMPGFTFNIARKLFKLENYLANLLLEPEKMHRLHDRIDDMLEDMIRNYAAAGVDSIMFPEDWGTQTQTLISPKLWHQEFFPRFKRLCQAGHECGIKIFMHSCGAVGAIIPGLMEAGVDLLQFDQPTLHGIDTLAGYQEKGKITFWCPVDIQKTLQTRDEELIRAEADELLAKLWKGRGGFVAGYYGDNTSIGLDPKWQQYACDEFIKKGRRED